MCVCVCVCVCVRVCGCHNSVALTRCAPRGSPQERFRQIDLGYVSAIASISRAASVPHFLLVSSEGANASSWFLYMKTKGEVENVVKGLNFPRTTIVRCVASPSSCGAIVGGT